MQPQILTNEEARAKLQIASVPTSVKPKASEYETIYILRPNVDAADAEKVFARAQEVFGKVDGKLLLVENWGKRKLAYLIKNFSRGIFVYLKYAGYDGAVAELERNLRLLEPVMRYQTVLLQRGVDIDAYNVEAEAVAFAAVEETEEEEEEETLEARLGLVSRDRGQSRFSDSEQSSEGASEAGAEEAAAAGTAAATEGSEEGAATAEAAAAPEAAAAADESAPVEGADAGEDEAKKASEAKSEGEAS